MFCRALVFADKSFAGKVPDMLPGTQEWKLLALITHELKSYMTAVENSKLRDGIRHILNISRHGNQYMQFHQPWALLKGSDADRYVYIYSEFESHCNPLDKCISQILLINLFISPP